MVDLKQQRLKALISELEAIRGRHTELITVYVPAGFSLNKVSGQIRNEQSTAQNIKSKAVKKNVMAALEKILQHLKLYKKTPEHGVAIFCGNVSDKEGVSDLEIWAVEPPEPVKVRLYRCDQAFVLDPLKEIVREREVYGLIVLDKSDAEIGVLKGKKVSSLKHLDSLVPGKTAKGGWCVHEDSLMQLSDGRICKIKDLGEKIFLSYDFKKLSAVKGKHNHYFTRTSNEACQIRTIAPTIEITVTPEHKFFIPASTGFITKRAGKLSAGDKLLAVRRMKIEGMNKKINADGIPNILNSQMARFMGYFTGDGSIEANRMTLHEGDEGLIAKYNKEAEMLFNLKPVVKARKGKNYFEMRLYSKSLADTLRKEFPGVFKSNDRHIPDCICSSPDDVVSAFIGGIWDAEGYATKSNNSLGITMREKEIISKLQLMLLRFGIISSMKTVNQKGSFAKHLRYALVITDSKSITNFAKNIPLLSKKKSKKINEIIVGMSQVSHTDQIPLVGSYVLSLIHKIGMTTDDFPRVQDFFFDKKGMSYATFSRSIVPCVEKRVKELESKKFRDVEVFRKFLRVHLKDIGKSMGITKSSVFWHKEKNPEKLRPILENHKKRMIKNGKEVLHIFKSILDSDIISVSIKSIESITPDGKFYDMEVPNFGNFIANGLILHNSQARYARVREGILHDFLKKVGEIASKEFKELRDLKGVVLGGPGAVKDEFMKGEFLDYEIQKKVLGTLDTSYTGIPGLEELLNRAEELLAEASITREKKLLARFFEQLKKDSGLAVYGFHEVMKALKKGAVEIILLSEAFDWIKVGLKCPGCKFRTDKTIRRDQLEEQKCPECNARLELTEEKDMTEDILKTSEQMGTDTEVISIDTREGEQLKELGGIAGILRYKLE